MSAPLSKTIPVCSGHCRYLEILQKRSLRHAKFVMLQKKNKTKDEKAGNNYQSEESTLGRISKVGWLKFDPDAKGDRETAASSARETEEDAIGALSQAGKEAVDKILGSEETSMER